MGCTTRNSKKLSKESRSIIKASRKGALDNIRKKLHTAMLRNNNRLPYAHITKLLNNLGKTPNFNWLTRNNIANKAFLKFKANIEEEKKRHQKNDEMNKNKVVGMNVDVSTSKDTALLSDLSGDVPSKNSSESVGTSKKSKGGRPVGTTIKAKEDKERSLFEAKNLITKRFSAVKRKSGCNGKVKNGTLIRIIEQMKEDLKLKNVTISPSAIRQRFYGKKEVCRHVAGHISPLEKIEATVISIVISMARI